MDAFLKIAIVGCGKIADAHVEELKKIPEARLAAVCDWEPLMAEQIAVRYGIPCWYSDFDQLLDQVKPDVVHVTTPPCSHVELAEKAMGKGCHVYVEKPFSVDVDGATRLVDTAKRLKRKITVGHSYEFDPAAVALRDLVRKGVIGDPVHVESYQGYNLQGPFGAAILANPDHWVHGLPGKLLQNNISHMIHKITEFVTDETPRVHAMGYLARLGRSGDVRDDMVDELRVLIVGEKTTGYGTFSSHARPVRVFARVYGTKNTVAVDYVSRTVVIEHGDKLPSAIGRLLPPFAQSCEFFRAGSKNVLRFVRADFHYFAGMGNLFRLFYRSILDGTDPPIPYGEILRVTRIMDDIFGQVATGAVRREPR